MKNHVSFLIITSVLLFACNNADKKETPGNNVYKQRLDSLENIVNQKDSSVHELLQSFNSIEQTLDSVSHRQHSISLSMDKQQGDLQPDRRERISEQIAAINELMEKNKQNIETLNQKLRRSNSRVTEFQNIINTLNDQITEKNTELEALNQRLRALNAQLAKLQASVDTLSTANSEQSELIAQQTASIRTAYYVVGNSKQLERMKVIDKHGGLLGMGKSTKLSQEFDAEHFTRVDYTQVLTIPIYGKKAKIVTTHPADSYVLDKDENNKYTTLRILQPEKFWSASKFLVVINS